MVWCLVLAITMAGMPCQKKKQKKKKKKEEEKKKKARQT